jgi:hypothetical protein
MVLYMNRHFSNTPIQNKLFGYISFLQISFYYFLSCQFSVDLFLFLCFQVNLEYHRVLVPQKAFIGYDQTITNDVGLVFLELVLPQFYLIYYHFWFDLSLCGHISNAISVFQLHSSFRCVVLLYHSILRHTSSRV